MEINISEIVNSKIKELEESKVIEQQIASSVEKTIVQAVKDACEDYRFRRDIEDKVKTEVSTVAANIGFSGYNTFIAETLKTLINNVLKQDVQEKIVETFNQLFINKIDKIKLSEIVKRYENIMCELDYDDKCRSDDGYFFVDFSGGEEDGSFRHWKLTFALESQKTDRYSHYSSSYGSKDYKLELNLMSYKEDDCSITSVKYEGKDLSKMDELRVMSSFEAFLASLYFNKTKVEFDINEDDVERSLGLD